MASFLLPASITRLQSDNDNEKNRTAPREDSPPPPPESEHLLHGEDMTTTVIASSNHHLDGLEKVQVPGTEKKQPITSSVAALIPSNNNNGNIDHENHTPYTKSHHHKPWTGTSASNILLGPYRSFFSENRETPKAVINRPSFGAVIAHLWVHVIPVFGTAALIGMNLWKPSRDRDGGGFEGWYIGAELWGPWGSEATLSFLQLAGKLHETVILGSLGVVAMDLVRYFLVYKPLGVPLGLLGAGSSFGDVKYLV